MLWKSVLAVIISVILTTTGLAGAFGDANAAYERGDYTTALKLLRPLGKQGDADALNMLGFMYEHGQGVPSSLTDAVKYYRLAADKGSTGAQITLGFLYYGALEESVPQDLEQAAMWFRAAADQGSRLAQGQLGRMYQKGEGVPQDYVLAYKWYNLAAVRWIAYARARDAIAANMTTAQITEAQRLAREWKPKR